MGNRWVLLSLVWSCLLAATSAYSYSADLYFRNLRTGDRNWMVGVEPGDTIAIAFDFSTPENEAWTELSGFIDFEGSSIVTWAVAEAIVKYIRDHHAIPGRPYTTFVYGPGEIRNDKFNPGRPTAPLITTAGIYWRMNIVDINHPQARSGIHRIAEFTVPLTARLGEELDFQRKNLWGTNDISSRLIDAQGARDKLQFNRVVVVSEPATLLGFLAALGAIIARASRRKK